MKINLNNLGKYHVPQSVKGGVCLEIGANVGNFFSKYKDFFKKIHYYEPVNETYNICLSKSNSMDNVTGYREAASSKDGENLEIVAHENNDSGSCSVKDGKRDWTDKVIASCSSVSLKTCIGRLEVEEIDYLKIDCECCEFEFMLDKDLSNIKHIGMELHWQKGKELWNKILEHLRKTHVIIGDTNFVENRNTDLYCVSKDLA